MQTTEITIIVMKKAVPRNDRELFYEFFQTSEVISIQKKIRYGSLCFFCDCVGVDSIIFRHEVFDMVRLSTMIS